MSANQLLSKRNNSIIKVGNSLALTLTDELGLLGINDGQEVEISVVEEPAQSDFDIAMGSETKPNDRKIMIEKAKVKLLGE